MKATGKERRGCHTTLIHFRKKIVRMHAHADIPGLYGEEMFDRYRGKSIGKEDPHVYAVADRAYRDMVGNERNQSLIVSGESGAFLAAACLRGWPRRSHGCNLFNNSPGAVC